MLRYATFSLALLFLNHVRTTVVGHGWIFIEHRVSSRRQLPEEEFKKIPPPKQLREKMYNLIIGTCQYQCLFIDIVCLEGSIRFQVQNFGLSLDILLYVDLKAWRFIF